MEKKKNKTPVPYSRHLKKILQAVKTTGEVYF